MRLLKKFSALPDALRACLTIAFTVIISLGLTALGIYGFGQYGIALFVLIPVFIGACVTILYSYGRKVSRGEIFLIGLITLVLLCITLMLSTMEGLICILMAAPLAIVFIWAGMEIGLGVISKYPPYTVPLFWILAASVPTVSFIEKENESISLTEAKTAIIINAKPEKVWQNVIVFGHIQTPTGFLFRAGIAYPIDAEIKGKGPGAVRYCNFTTGSFIEPITVWDEPRLLAFDVQDCPAPMKELNFWDVDAPHLHDYFVSKRGQFKLTALPNGKTQLEGTTWYYHRIYPEAYWQLWSQYIIHKIHERVLTHIKQSAEGQ